MKNMKRRRVYNQSKRLHVTVDSELLNKLKHYANDNQISLGLAIEKALVHFFKKVT